MQIKYKAYKWFDLNFEQQEEPINGSQQHNNTQKRVCSPLLASLFSLFNHKQKVVGQSNSAFWPWGHQQSLSVF